MTIEEIFCSLYEKYGEDLNWHLIPFTESKGFFVKELKKELVENDIIFNKEVYAVAKCDSNDDVLFLTGNENGEEIWRIYHLTYSSDNLPGYPQYKEFTNRDSVGAFIEEQLINEFL